MNGQWVGYWFVRLGLAAGGLLIVMGTASCHFFMPDLCYDHLPEPPPLRERWPYPSGESRSALLGGATRLCP